ncbi:RING finger protein nhl-1 [Oopsacas minuta]|uniref:RING finger protein nhl-1 n=1 Tax=Oopsacas minuta TaxID=111878 RepID=A0AAV7KKQ4_9METZ|nr:RING finger protein nhl-1 [Oopsacas minuta]
MSAAVPFFRLFVTTVFINASSLMTSFLKQDIIEMANLDFPPISSPHYSQFIPRIVHDGKLGNNASTSKCLALSLHPETGNIFRAESSGRVCIFSPALEFITYFCHTEMIHPFGIVIIKDHIYITDCRKHGLLCFVEDSGFCKVMYTVGEGEDGSKLNNLRQLAISCCGEIYVIERINLRIIVFSCDELKYIRSFKCPSIPFDIKLNESEVFVLTIRSSHMIHVFSKLGALLRSIIPREEGGICPLSFYIDSFNNLLVCDRSSKRIKMFSRQGQILHYLQLPDVKEREGRSIYPFGITMNDFIVITGSPADFHDKYLKDDH